MQKQQVQFAGVVTYWSSSSSSQETLREGLNKLGLGSFVPEKMSSSEALKLAMQTCGNRRRLVRPLSGTVGYALVDETASTSSVDHSCGLVGKLSGLGLSFSDESSPLTHGIRADFEKYLGVVPHRAVTASLVKLVGEFGGVSLRDRGGIYWIPEEKAQAWADAARVFESASVLGSTSVYEFNIVHDDKSIRGVVDALISEIEGEVSDIQSAISAGTLGARALESRQTKAVEMAERIETFEKTFSVSLATLRASVDSAKSAAVTATLAAMAG